MPAAEMISGTIIGEISTRHDRPTERHMGLAETDGRQRAETHRQSVATGAMRTEFQSACCQSELVKKSR